MSSAQFEDYLKQPGIKHEYGVAYTHQQNGVAERMNRSLVECARTMLDMLTFLIGTGWKALQLLHIFVTVYLLTLLINMLHHLSCVMIVNPMLALIKY